MTAKIWEITPEGILRINEREKHLAGLIASQLNNYDLQSILELRPGNETLLIQTEDVWQIAAFADLYAQKIAQTGFPKQIDYDRATRLYQACLDSGDDNAYFQKKIEDLKRTWEEKTGK